MALFESSEELQNVLFGFFNIITKDPQIAPKLLKSKLIIRFNYTEPDLTITADCSGEEIKVFVNDTNLKPEVEMWMKAEIAHKFWMGKVNLLIALTRKQMIAKGPIPKILQLLPAITPAYALYPEYLKNNGWEKYLI